jgi:hypothetical protein
MQADLRQDNPLSLASRDNGGCFFQPSGELDFFLEFMDPPLQLDSNAHDYSTEDYIFLFFNSKNIKNIYIYILIILNLDLLILKIYF